MSLEAKRLCKLALGPVLLLMSFIVMAADGDASKYNMSPGVTAVGREVYDLHMTIIGICAVIGILVFAVMFYSIIYHRKSRGVTPATFHESTKVEIAWTVVPFIILIAMAIPATTTLLEIYNNDASELDIAITGYQWKWKYEYLNKNGENVSYFSNLRTPQTEIHNTAAKGENYLLEVDEPLVLPVDTKVRFLVTGNDVIHSFWVPMLAVKRDAIPGFINEVWTKAEKEGVFRGQCAELCGKGHGFMPIVVNVVSKEKFAEWMGKKQADAAELKKLMAQNFTLDQQMERGKAVYATNCLACHGANGEGGVGKPIAKSPIATGDMAKHLDTVIHGVPGTAMQAFGAQLNDVDLSAVITYERNAFGNNMGETVQPIDVFNRKKG